jgi:hypothetical protein
MDHCAICGRLHPIEQHHMVRRSAGELFRHGKKVPKPTITLCGFGNTLKDPDGRFYCHGMAHAHMLHFRFTDRLEFLITKEPTDYLTALSMDGWMPVKEEQ